MKKCLFLLGLLLLTVATKAETTINLNSANQTISAAGDYLLTSNNEKVTHTLTINSTSSDTVRIKIQNLNLQRPETSNSQTSDYAIIVNATNTAPIVFNVVGNNIIKGAAGNGSNYTFGLNGNTKYFFRGSGTIDSNPTGTTSSNCIQLNPTTGNDNNTVVNFDDGITIKNGKKILFAGNANHKRCIINVTNANLQSESDQVFNIKRATLNIDGGNFSTNQTGTSPAGVIFLDEGANLSMGGGTITSKNVGISTNINSNAMILGGEITSVNSAISYESTGYLRILNGSFTTTGGGFPCVKVNGAGTVLIGGGTMIGKVSNALRVNYNSTNYPNPRVQILWNDSINKVIPAPLILGEGASPAVDFNGNNYTVLFEGGTIKHAVSAAGVRINSTTSDAIVFAMKGSAEIVTASAENVNVASKATIKIGNYTIYRASNEANLYKIWAKKSNGAFTLRASDINTLEKIEAENPMELTFIPKTDGIPDKIFVPTEGEECNVYSFKSDDFVTYKTYEIRIAQKRNINYDANGAENFNNGGNPDAYWEHNGTSTFKPATADCKKFVGWRDVTGTPITRISEEQTGDVTVFAEWEALTISDGGAINGGDINNLVAGTPGDTVCYGSVPTKTITEITAPTYEAGQTLTYQWQMATGPMLPGTILTWTNIEGANEKTYTPTQTIYKETYYRRLVTSNCTIAYELSQNVWPVIIRTSPDAGKAVSEGHNATFCDINDVPVITAQGYTGNFAGWGHCVNPDPTIDFDPYNVGIARLENATSATLEAKDMDLQIGENYYCAIVINECDTTTSNFVTITYYKRPTAPTEIIGDTIVARGATTTLTATGGENGDPDFGFAWEYVYDINTSPIADNGATITTIAINDTTTIRVQRLGRECDSSDWLYVTITPTDDSHAGPINGGGLSCDLNDIVPVEINKEYTIGNVIYWQKSNKAYGWDENIYTDQIVWVELPNTATFELSPEQMEITAPGIYFFRAAVQNGTTPISYSNPAMVNYQITPDPVEFIQGPETVGYNKPVTLTAVGGNEGTPVGGYEWGYGNKEGENVIEGATSATLTLDSLANDTCIWVRRTGGCTDNTESTFKCIKVEKLFDITYDWGDVEPDSTAVTDDTFTPGDNKPLDDGKTHRPFYHFEGWHLDDPNGEIVGSTDDLPEGDHTLYGEWKREIEGAEIVIAQKVTLAVRNAGNHAILREPTTIYTWYKDGEKLPSQRHFVEVKTGEPVPAGYYKVEIKIDEERPIVIDRIITEDSVNKLYPNPVKKNGTIFVETDTKNMQRCELFDAFGRIESSAKIVATEQGYQVKIDAQAGIYALKLTDKNGKTQVHRIVVK